MAISPLPAADTWWHLAAGDYMLQNHTFPTRDPFSFTAGEHLWTNHEWLVEIIFAWVYGLVGLSGLYWFKILVIAVSFGALPALALYRHSARLDWLCLCPLIMLAGELSYFVDVRAYLFTYLFLSATLFAMLEFRQNPNKGWLIFCILMQIIWVNSHGAFILGPAVMGVFMLIGPRRKELGAAVAITTLSACINPYGVEMLLFPFSLLKIDAFSVGLNEWAKPDLIGAQLKYSLLVAFFAILVLLRRKRLDWAIVLTTLAFVLLGLKAWRHEPLAALCLCYAVPRLLPDLSLNPRLRSVVSGLVLTFGTVFFVSRAGMPAEKMSLLQMFPTRAVKFIQKNPELPKQLWNPYGWGGYLLWQLGPETKIFFDGRAHTVYPETVYRDGYYIQYGEPWLTILRNKGLDTPSVSRLQLLDQYEIDLVLTNKFQGKLDSVLARDSNWFPVFGDSSSTLFLRDTPRYRELAKGLKSPEF